MQSIIQPFLYNYDTVQRYVPRCLANANGRSLTLEDSAKAL